MMPWLKSSVPKFGSWEKSVDVPYSSIFDKARAEKERFLHISESDFKDFPSAQNLYKNSNVGAGKMTLLSDKARADRERFLRTPQQDKTFTDTHQIVLQNPEATAGRGASHKAYDGSSGLRTSTLGFSGPRSPSCAQVSQEQQNCINASSNPWNQFDARACNSSFPSGAPSRQPLQVGGTRQTSFFNERPLIDQAGAGFQGRPHARLARTNGRYMREENPPAAKTRSAQGGLGNSSVADMGRKHTVPKFGDWSSGDGFTAAFNKVRIEKSSKYAPNRNAKAVSPLRPDEDLYKSSEFPTGSTESKKQRPRGEHNKRVARGTMKVLPEEKGNPSLKALKEMPVYKKELLPYD